MRLKAVLIRHMNFVPLRWEKLDLLPSASDKPALNAVKLCVCVRVCVCVRMCVCVCDTTD